MGPKKEFQEKIIKETSIPAPGGGDSHIHVFDNGFVITTRLPGGDAWHDEFDNEGNYKGGSW